MNRSLAVPLVVVGTLLLQGCATSTLVTSLREGSLDAVNVDGVSLSDPLTGDLLEVEGGRVFLTTATRRIPAGEVDSVADLGGLSRDEDGERLRYDAAASGVCVPGDSLAAALTLSGAAIREARDLPVAILIGTSGGTSGGAASPGAPPPSSFALLRRRDGSWTRCPAVAPWRREPRPLAFAVYAALVPFAFALDAVGWPFEGIFYAALWHGANPIY